MSYSQIKFQQVDSIAWITLFRPDKLNSLTPVMLKELVNLLTKLNHDENCKVIVVTGEGRAFSAGVDLDVFKITKVEPGYKMHQDGMKIMELLETSDKVTIAMVNGYCFTGAMELMMAFDLIVAADEAKIGDTHAKWGIPPKWGMTQRLMAQVGKRKAMELSFTTEAISGKEAERIYLINKSVPLTELKSTVETLAQKITKNSAQTIAAIKKLYQYGSLHSLKEGIQYELDLKTELTDKADQLKDFKKNL